MSFTDAKMEDAAAEEHKQRELVRAIERLDRKFARKLIVDEDVAVPACVVGEPLLRFLRLAVQSRDPALVREVLKRKPELNNRAGSEILWIVAEDGDTEIATMLVRAGAALNRLSPRDRCEQSLLHVLIASDSRKKHQLAVLMMEHGAEIEAEDSDGDTPLEYAIAKDALDVVEELVRRGAYIDEFVVQQAVLSSKAPELMLILIRGQFSDAKSPSDKVALMLVFLTYIELDETDLLPCVKVLLDLDILRDEVVFLFSAVLCDKIKMVELFLDNGFGTNILSILLHLSTALEDSSIAELLIKRGANINYRMDCKEFGHKNQYPIHTACESGSLSNVKLLLRLGADINVTDSIGNTPFSFIEDTNLNDLNKEVIKHFATLISKGVKVNERDMKFICSKADLLTFYQQCLEELQKMKKFKIFNHISIYTMLIEDVKQLSWLTRNCRLVENYSKAQLKVCFPLYHADVEWKFKNSEKRKKLLLPQDKAACEILNEILPNLVVSKIILQLYMDNVSTFQCSMDI